MKILIILIAALTLLACQRADQEPVVDRADERADEHTDQRADERFDERADERFGRLGEYAGERAVFACDGEWSRIVLAEDETAVVTTDAGPLEGTYEINGEELSITLSDGESMEFMVQGDMLHGDEDVHCERVG
jgi:hypothetical protein